MEPPFNLAATVLQMPGVFVSEWLAEIWGVYSGLFQWGATFCIQSLTWTAIGLILLIRRFRKIVDISE